MGMDLISPLYPANWVKALAIAPLEFLEESEKLNIWEAIFSGSISTIRLYIV